MNSDAVQLFSAMLGLATLATSLVTCAALLGRGRIAWADSWLEYVRGSALWLMCIVTSGAMVGSLYFSESVGYAPCKLCWYQRIVMYSLAVITFVAALRRDTNIARYTIVMAPIGLAVSTYHYLLEWYPTLESNVCSIDVPCTTIWFREFGFVTLSFMAGSAFLFVVSMSIVLVRSHSGLSTSTTIPAH